MRPSFDPANARHPQSSLPTCVNGQSLQSIKSEQQTIKSEQFPQQEDHHPPTLKSGSAHTAARAEWEIPVANVELSAFLPFQTSAGTPAGLPAPAVHFFPGDYLPSSVTASATAALPSDTVADLHAYNALRTAVAKGDVYLAATLIKNPGCQQALLQMQPGGQISPLMMASRDNKVELVLTLINTSRVNSAAVDSQLLLHDQYGKTALHYAEEKCHGDVLDVLRPMVGYALQRQQVAESWPVQWDHHPFMTPNHYAEFSNFYKSIQLKNGVSRYGNQ